MILHAVILKAGRFPGEVTFAGSVCGNPEADDAVPALAGPGVPITCWACHLAASLRGVVFA